MHKIIAENKPLNAALCIKIEMAESYSCNGEWVHFSNDACQDLQLTWAKIAEAFDGEPAMKELAHALKEQSKSATGVAAIGIDEEFLDEPYSRNQIKVAWFNVMEILIADIRNCGSVSRSMDVNWSGELRDSWLERLTKMKDCLSRQIKT